MKKITLLLALFVSISAFGQTQLPLHYVSELTADSQGFKSEPLLYSLPDSQEEVCVSRELTESQQEKFDELIKPNDDKAYLLRLVHYDNHYLILVGKTKSSDTIYITDDGVEHDSFNDVINLRYGDIATFNEMKKWSDKFYDLSWKNERLLIFVNHKDLKNRLAGLRTTDNIFVVLKSVYDVLTPKNVHNRILATYPTTIEKLTGKYIKFRVNYYGADDIDATFKLTYEQALENFLFISIGE